MGLVAGKVTTLGAKATDQVLGRGMRGASGLDMGGGYSVVSGCIHIVIIQQATDL